jgi:hypothetical protein
MSISALLGSSYLQLLSSLNVTDSSQKPAQTLLNTASTTAVSPHTAPDTYTSSQSNSDAISIFGTTPYAASAQSSTSADALAAAKATAQQDAEAAALAEENNPGGSGAALSQLSKDMANLATVMRDNSVSNSASLAANGASNTGASDSIVIAFDTPYGSIAAIASDSANSNGSAETSSVAYVSANGDVQASGQGSVTTADGTTTSVSVGVDASASTNANNNTTLAFGAYASLSTQSSADTKQKMEWAAVLVGSASGSDSKVGNETNANSLSSQSLSHDSGTNQTQSTMQNQTGILVAAAYGASYSDQSSSSWISASAASLSLYA